MSTTRSGATQTPPAGWYPAPHANYETRYWDGQRWLDTPPTAHDQQRVTPASGATQPRRLGLAVTALILGIAAFVAGLIPWLGLLLAMGAIAVGVTAMVKRQPKGLAITGTSLGGAALVAGLIATISFTAFLAAGASSSPTPPLAPTVAATDSGVEAEQPSETREQSEDQEPAEVAAPAPDGKVTSPFPQPYIAKGLLGGEKYSLTARIIDANANALVEGWNQFNDDAPTGFKYVVVELTMTGIDPDGVEPSLAEWDMSLATSEGNEYSSEFVVLGDGMPSMSDGPTLYPGSTFTGFTAYIVPEAAETFLIHDNGNYVSF